MKSALNNDMRNMMFSMLFGAVFSVGATPYVATALLKELDASVGQMAFIPFVVQFSAVLGLPFVCLIERFGTKRATLLTVFLSRLAYLAMVLLLLTPFLRGAGAASLVLCLYSFSLMIGSACAGPANAWFRDLLPSRVQGSFLGRRNAFGAAVVALLMPFFGFFFDKGLASGMKLGPLFLLILALPLVAGFLDPFFLSKVAPAKEEPKSASAGSFGEILEAFRSRQLWRCAFLIALSLSGAWWLAPFAIILCFEMGMSAFLTGLFTALASIGLALGIAVGGRLSDSSKESIRKLFFLLPLLIAGATFALGVVLALLFSKTISLRLAELFAMAAFFAAMFGQGALSGMHAKYSFVALPKAGASSFSLLVSIQSLLSLAVLGASASLGSWAAAHAAELSSFLPRGFHFLHLIFACSIATGVVSSLFLRKAKLYETEASRAAASFPLTKELKLANAENANG